MLTIIILATTKDQHLAEALSSAKFAYQILLVTQTSNPFFSKLAQQYQAKLIHQSFNQDFSALRNFALTQVQTPWALFLDADEQISLKLQEEIKANIQTNEFSGFYLKRQDFFLGRTLEHGETANVQLLRLAKYNSGIWYRPVHEEWQVDGPTKLLQNPLLHRPHHTLWEFFSKINHYTEIEAEHRQQEITTTLFELFTYPLGKFFYNYIFKLGFLDGFPGLVMAFFMSLHSLIVRVKLYEKSAT